MSESITGRLSRAFDLIEADRLAEARDLLEPLLTSHQDNPDVWWLYAHAVEDMAPAEDALRRVQELDPNYPGADKLMASLAGAKASQGMLDTSFDDLDIDSLMSDDEDYESDTSGQEDFEDGATEEQRSSIRDIFARLALPLAIVALLFFVFVIINPFGGDDGDGDTDVTPTTDLGDDDEQPTVVVVVGTATAMSTSAPLPTATVEALVTATPTPTETAEETAIMTTPTSEMAAVPPAEETEAPESTAEAQSVGTDAIESALADAGLTLVEGSGGVETTSLGETVLVSVCSSLGEELREAFPTALQAAAGESSAFEGEADAIGIRFVDCDSNELLNALGVDLQFATAFADGAIDADTFRAQWRPIIQ